MDALWRDVRYGVRFLAKNRGFTLTAVLVLALGIGANSAMFSIVRAVLLRPLALQEPERLALVWESNPAQGFDLFTVSPANFVDWSRSNETFTDLAAYVRGNPTVIVAGEPQRVSGASVSAAFFPLLGMDPALGRWILSEDIRAGNERVVVLSHGIWARSFGSDPEVIGKSIRVDAAPHTIVGVMPPGLDFPLGAEVWTPLVFDFDVAGSRGAHFLVVFGRLRPGITFGEAETRMKNLAAVLEQDYPETNRGWIARVIPLQENLVAASKDSLLILMGIVGCVLLIACANLAGMLVAAGSARANEITIRTALGATRSQILRQFLTESVVLSLAGSIPGLLLARYGLAFIVSSVPQNIPRLSEAAIDAEVLVFTSLITVAAGLLFGLAPAIHFTRSSASLFPTAPAKGLATKARSRLDSIVVVAEVALAFVVVVGAGLMARTLWSLSAVDPGFNAENMLTLRMNLPREGYGEPHLVRGFVGRLVSEVRELPQVSAVSVSSSIPMEGSFNIAFEIAGNPPPGPGEKPGAEMRVVTEGFFRTLQIPLLRGRLFSEQDSAEAPPVVLINEALAQRYFRDGDPIGRRMRVEYRDTPELREIVGIVGNVRQSGLGSDVQPEYYLPYDQIPFRSVTLLVRAAGDPLNITGGVRSRIVQLDPGLAAFRIQTMEQVVSASIAGSRFTTWLLGVFAFVALLLATVGIYGVISYAASRRTVEVGIRMALGARRADILRLFMGRGMIPAWIGIGVGLAGALATSRLLGGMLHGVTPTDPITYLTILVILLVVAISASYFPARRASKADPARALQHP